MNYGAGMVSMLFIVAIALIVAEVLLPTGGFLGALGAGVLVYGLLMSFVSVGNELYAMLAAAVVTVVSFVLLTRYIPRSALWKHLSLSNATKTEEGYVSAEARDELVGKEAVVLTDIRPAGTVEIDGSPVDVVSEGAYIEKGARVRVISTNGSRVVVRKI